MLRGAPEHRSADQVMLVSCVVRMRGCCLERSRLSHATLTTYCFFPRFKTTWLRSRLRHFGSTEVQSLIDRRRAFGLMAKVPHARLKSSPPGFESDSQSQGHDSTTADRHAKASEVNHSLQSLTHLSVNRPKHSVSSVRRASLMTAQLRLRRATTNS